MANRDVLRFPIWPGRLPDNAILWFTDVASDQEFRFTPEQLPAGQRVGVNDRPSLWMQVRCYSIDTPQYEPNDATLVDLDQANMCLNTVITVDWGPDGYGRQYRVTFDPAGPLRVYKDGRFIGRPDIPASYVLIGSDAEAAAGVDVYDPEELRVPADAIRLHLIGALTLSFAAAVDLDADDFEDGIIPAPTGNPAADAGIWRQRPVSAPGYIGFQAVTVEAVRYLASEEQLPIPRDYRLLRYDEQEPGDLSQPTRAAYDVLVTVATPTQLRPAALRIDNETGDITEGIYDLETDEFTEGSNGVGLTPDALVDAIDNVNGDVVSQVLSDKVLLSLLPDRVAASHLLSFTPSSRTFWVEGGGQQVPGRRGDEHRPFASLQAAHDAASAGDLLVVKPGGLSVAPNGQRAYGDLFICTKKINVVCLPGVNITADVNVGGFGGFVDNYRPLWHGGIIWGSLICFRQGSTRADYRIHNTEFEGDGRFYGFGAGNYGTHRCSFYLRDCRFNSTKTAANDAPILITGRTDMGPNDLVLDNCVVVTAGSPAIRFTPHGGVAPGKAYLRGAVTEFRGGPRSATLPTVPAAEQLTEADWLVDERPAGGAGADLSNYYTKEQGDARYAPIGSGGGGADTPPPNFTGYHAPRVFLCFNSDGALADFPASGWQTSGDWQQDLYRGVAHTNEVYHDGSLRTLGIIGYPGGGTARTKGATWCRGWQLFWADISHQFGAASATVNVRSAADNTVLKSITINTAGAFRSAGGADGRTPATVLYLDAPAACYLEVVKAPGNYIPISKALAF